MSLFSQLSTLFSVEAGLRKTAQDTADTALEEAQAARGHTYTPFSDVTDLNPDPTVNRIWAGEGDPENAQVGDIVAGLL